MSEASVQYCILREYKPRRLIEIGSGTSTRFAAYAMSQNAQDGYEGFLQSIDPAPRTLDDNKTIKSRKDIKFEFEYLKRSVTEIPLTHFDKLAAGDVLFIDSSHIFDFKSDVRYELSDILLRLKRGVIVHIHDIWQPCGDGRNQNWNEQELVMMILAYVFL